MTCLDSFAAAGQTPTLLPSATAALLSSEISSEPL